jgi:hypothetical protein
MGQVPDEINAWLQVEVCPWPVAVRAVVFPLGARLRLTNIAIRVAGPNEK